MQRVAKAAQRHSKRWRVHSRRQPKMPPKASAASAKSAHRRMPDADVRDDLEMRAMTHVAPTAAEVLSRPPYRGKLLIDGRWIDGAAGATLERHSPAHGTLVAVYALAQASDTEQAIAAAR